MNKNTVIWTLITVIVLVVLVFLLMPQLSQPKEKPLPPPPVASPEAKSALPLPRVVTLYQKGDGESDLAAFVSKELSNTKIALAVFRAVNVMDEPQMAEFYGVNNTPAIIFLRPNGKVFKVYEGYLDKRKILSVLSKMEKS